MEPPELPEVERRYVAPINVVSVQPEYPRYSVVEDRQAAAAQSASAAWDSEQAKAHSAGHTREYKAAALLVLLIALAAVVALSLFL